MASGQKNADSEPLSWWSIWRFSCHVFISCLEICEGIDTKMESVKIAKIQVCSNNRESLFIGRENWVNEFLNKDGLAAW